MWHFAFNSHTPGNYCFHLCTMYKILNCLLCDEYRLLVATYFATFYNFEFVMLRNLDENETLLHDHLVWTPIVTSYDTMQRHSKQWSCCWCPDFLRRHAINNYAIDYVKGPLSSINKGFSYLRSMSIEAIMVSGARYITTCVRVRTLAPIATDTPAAIAGIFITSS